MLKMARPIALPMLVVLACLWTAGCASQKVLQATGGSRADGTVNLSFETGMFENPVIDWEQAGRVARKRCTAWGYTDAEAFRGTTTQCQAYNAYGNCIHAFVTVPFQCINEGTASPPAVADTKPSYAPPAGAGPAVTTSGNAPAALLQEPSSPVQATAYKSETPASTVQQSPIDMPALPSRSGEKPPPIFVFKHASDNTSANQSSDFDDLIDSVANGATPAAGAN